MQMQRKTSSTAIVIMIAVFSVLIAGGVIAAALAVVNNRDNAVASTEVVKNKDNDRLSEWNNPSILATDHVRGKRDSDVVVVEYADPQCPGCASMMPKMNAIYEKYKDRVAFVYRHYPIAMHQNAVSAAVAIEAAGEQGYFWEMLDAVFDNRADWIYESGNGLADAYVEIFEDIAASKGDSKKFRNDLSSNKLKVKVEADKKHGQNDDISATPTIIVNGKQIDFYTSGDAQKTIEDAIESALKN